MAAAEVAPTASRARAAAGALALGVLASCTSAPTIRREGPPLVKAGCVADEPTGSWSATDAAEQFARLVQANDPAACRFLAQDQTLTPQLASSLRRTIGDAEVSASVLVLYEEDGQTIVHIFGGGSSYARLRVVRRGDRYFVLEGIPVGSLPNRPDEEAGAGDAGTDGAPAEP